MKATPGLDDLDLGLSIESTEGLDVNHASRARLQFLAAQSNAMLIQIQFADAKAAALMTLSGLLALHGPVTIATATQASFLQLASFVCIAACLGGCILTIIPRFPKEEIRRKLYDVDRYSWPGLVDSSRDPSDYPEFMRKAEASQLVLSLARANQATAQVLHRKFSVMRVTFGVGALGLSLLGLNGLLSLGS